MTGYETKNSRKESVKQSKITSIPPNRWSAVSPHFSFGNAADWIVVHAPPLDAILAARKAGNFVCDVSHLEGQEDWRMPVSGKLWHRRVGSAETWSPSCEITSALNYATRCVQQMSRYWCFRSTRYWRRNGAVGWSRTKPQPCPLLINQRADMYDTWKIYRAG